MTQVLKQLIAAGITNEHILACNYCTILYHLIVNETKGLHSKRHCHVWTNRLCAQSNKNSLYIKRPNVLLVYIIL
jgi:hypothetical protein